MKRKLIVALLGAAATQCIIASPVRAQAAPEPAQATASDTGGLEEIVVVARKRAENLQTVPLSISAVTGEGLESRAIQSSFDLQQAVPGLRIAQVPASPMSALPSIRGQVQEESLISVDPSVGTYLNGVYAGRSDGAVFNLIDVERVEVARGPQGTLYGRNTTGGAILVFTKLPELDETSGWVRAGYSTWDRAEVAGVINLPVSDTFGFRFVGQHVTSDGYIDDTITGKGRLGNDDWLGRASALFRRDGVQVDLVYDHYEFDRKGGPAVRLVGFTPAAPAAPGGPRGLAALETQLQGTIGPVPLPIGGSGIRPNPNIATYLDTDKDETASGEDGFLKGKVQSATANTNVELGADLDLKVIYGWRKFNDNRLYDFDGTPALLVQVGAAFGAEQHSVEGQLLGKSLDGKLDWVAGGYFFDEEGYSNTENFALPLISMFSKTVFEASGKNRSYAAFGQANYSVTDSVRITAGLRHTWDDKSIVLGNRTLRAANPAAPVFLRCDVPVGVDVDGPDPAAAPGSTKCEGRQSRDFGFFSWLGSVDYTFDNGTLIWAKVAQASRSGGFNARPGRLGVDAFPFGPERVREHEVGIKWQSDDNRARVNASAFLSKGDNLQRTQLFIVGGAPSTVIQNAAKATFKGIEIDGQLAVTDDLTATASVTTLDADFDRYRDGNGNDLSNTLFRFTADVQANVGLNYKRPTSFGSIGFGANYDWVGNYKPAREPIAAGGRKIDFGILNLRAEAEIGRFTIAGYVRNATDKVYSIADLIFAAPLDLTLHTNSPGRSVGIEGTVRF